MEPARLANVLNVQPGAASANGRLLPLLAVRQAGTVPTWNLADSDEQVPEALTPDIFPRKKPQFLPPFIFPPPLGLHPSLQGAPLTISPEGLAPRKVDDVDMVVNPQLKMLVSSLKQLKAVGNIDRVAFGLRLPQNQDDPGSLTLSGIDVSNFVAPLRAIPLIGTNEMDLVVKLHHIYAIKDDALDQKPDQHHLLLTKPVNAMIDSNSYFSLLPKQVIDAILAAYGGREENGEYLVPSDAAIDGNALRIAFGDDKTDVTIPLAAFIIEEDGTTASLPSRDASIAPRWDDEQSWADMDAKPEEPAPLESSKQHPEAQCGCAKDDSSQDNIVHGTGHGTSESDTVTINISLNLDDLKPHEHSKYSHGVQEPETSDSDYTEDESDSDWKPQVQARSYSHSTDEALQDKHEDGEHWSDDKLDDNIEWSEEKSEIKADVSSNDKPKEEQEWSHADKINDSPSDALAAEHAWTDVESGDHTNWDDADDEGDWNDAPEGDGWEDVDSGNQVS
jgi:hypothetical protein